MGINTYLQNKIIMITYHIKKFVMFHHIRRKGAKMNFNERLIKCRQEAGLTQEKTANLLAIKRTTYAKYETGENQPNYQILSKMADLFGVSTDFLLGRCAREQSSQNMQQNQYIEWEKIKDLIEEMGMKSSDIFDINKWKYLDKEGVQEIKNHFDWVVYKSKQ